MQKQNNYNDLWLIAYNYNHNAVIIYVYKMPYCTETVLIVAIKFFEKESKPVRLIRKRICNRTRMRKANKNVSSNLYDNAISHPCNENTMKKSKNNNIKKIKYIDMKVCRN